MEKWILILFAYFVYCAVMPMMVSAGGSCYSAKEYEADRGLRLHSDLEVIMLTCRYATDGRPLEPLYSNFVKRYNVTIHNWESVIARTYAGTGGSRDEVIDNFRTNLANQKGNEAARMGPKPFCAQWANFIPYIVSLTPQQLYTYIRQPDITRPTKRPACTS